MHSFQPNAMRIWLNLSLSPKPALVFYRSDKNSVVEGSDVFSRKNESYWIKVVVAVVVVTVAGYCIKNNYYEQKRRSLARELAFKEEKQCQNTIRKAKLLPIRGGASLNRERLVGFHISSTIEDGQCIADVLEGSVWWTGRDIIPASFGVGQTHESSWRMFNVGARLYKNKNHGCTERNDCPKESISTGYRNTKWPEELTIKLKNYPGLELWLYVTPPAVENRFRVTDFVIRDWRRRDGTPRIISCPGLDYPSADLAKNEFNTKQLLTFDTYKLEGLDIRNINAVCEVDLDNFEFAGGDARVSFGTNSLAEAPHALHAINEYLTRSIITGSEQ